jgi:sec-independent protein translocase protein TatB
MFDIGASELLMIVVVAIVVIGPKDLPLALRSAGRWVAKVRSVSGHFRSGIETMIREAELEEMEKKWREQNAAIMATTPNTVADWEEPVTSASADPDLPPPLSKAEMLAGEHLSGEAEPQLPLPHVPPPPP